MRDAKHLLAKAAALRSSGQPFVVATVIRTRGSSYRPPGARMLMTEQQRVFGSVSGGCLEQRLLRTGFWQTRQGPTLVTMDSSDPDDPDAMLGCGGVVDILLERGHGPHDALAFATGLLRRRQRGVIVTVFASDHAASASWPVGHRWMLDESVLNATTPSGCPAQVFADARQAMSQRNCVIAHSHGAHYLLEPVYAPLDLLVFGTGLDAQPLIASADRVGWNVLAWDATGRVDIAARFGGVPTVHRELSAMAACIAQSRLACAVVMGHDKRHDREALAMLLASSASYIGVLGPLHRTIELNPLAVEDPRVYAPIGLDIDADCAEEIAVAITAEILATCRRTSTIEPSGQSLRGRSHIHSQPRP